MSTILHHEMQEVRLPATRLLCSIPAIAAFAYPYFVMALYNSGQLLSRASTASSALVASIAMLVAVVLTYGVPAISLAVAVALGRVDVPSTRQVRARRIAHLAFASSSLFVLIGVVFYLLGSANGDYLFWAVLWAAALALLASSADGKTATADAASGPPAWLRVSHGASALAIVLIFLAWHLLNHMTALWSFHTNEVMMKALRKWYRSDIVQPILVALFIYQVVSGVALLWRYTALKTDFPRTLQTATGALLTAFIVSHLNAVFVLGRGFSHVDTTFSWAGGAPTGLLADPWNVRLIPHYSLAVWLVITHAGLGLRMILLNHGRSRAVADRAAWALSVLGLLVSLIILAALLEVHGPQH
ncbi:MAG TPA: hypothetical protein VFA81_12555 [Burkholderiales bacterium]|nr:hypothetical protein [Burkholderiales bacterium]